MSPLTIIVYATTSFEGFHKWPDAPDEVAFLRELHRHRFHVRVEVKVQHDDRQVEFILLQREVDRVIRFLQATKDVSCWSCERWARELFAELPLWRCEVSEDGENGAIVMRGDG